MSSPHELSTAPFINLLLYRYLSKGALTVAARDRHATAIYHK